MRTRSWRGLAVLAAFIALTVTAACAGQPVALALAGAAATSPSPRSVSTYEITTSTLATDYVFKPIAKLAPLQLTAGKPVNLYGVFAGTSTVGSLMETRVNCQAPDGTRSIAASSSTNHLGTSGTVVKVATHYLYTPSQTGLHTCLLQALAGRCQISPGVKPMAAHSLPATFYATPLERALSGCVTQPQYTVNVVAGTTLQLNTFDRTGGVGWGQPADVHLRKDAPSKWTLIAKWTAPAGATSVRVHSGPEISVESTGGNRPFVGDVTLYVTQLHANGTKCQRYTKTARVEISGTLHHYKLNHVLTVPVSKACSSRQFAIQTLVTYVPSTVAGETRHGAVVHWWHYSSAYAAPASWAVAR